MYKLELDLPIPAHLPTHLVFIRTEGGNICFSCTTQKAVDDMIENGIARAKTINIIPLDLSKRTHLLIALLLKSRGVDGKQSDDSKHLSKLLEEVFTIESTNDT